MAVRPEPITVVDVRDPAAWSAITGDRIMYERLMGWVRLQGLKPEVIYRLEVYLVDCPSAKVYEFALDEHGHKYVADGDVARREPYEVALTSLPPTL